MKKIYTKDIQNRKTTKQFELEHFTLKQIYTNSNFIKLLRWNALDKLNKLPKKSSKTLITNRCVKTINKKTFHKFSNLSRTVFINLAKSGLISGLRKSSW
jgi:small subunit ribosomal protein S14